MAISGYRLKEVLACSEIENVERIAAQLEEAKKEADRSAGEAATAVAVAQDAAERVTALATDLEHAKAEADSFALIAELEAAKDDADNAAAYWSNPADVEDYRIHCDDDKPLSLQSSNGNGKSYSQPFASPPMPFANRHDINKQTDLCTLHKVKSQSFNSPLSFNAESLPPCAEPAIALMAGVSLPETKCGQCAGCFLVFEEKNQGTLTATWSRITPVFSCRVSQVFCLKVQWAIK